MPLSDRNYFLTGASGFVGKSVFSFLGEDNVQIWKRNESFQLDGAVSVIHLAGMAHDLKNTSSSQEYYEVNTELTKKVFDAFLESDAKVFIGLSSVKAAADEVKGELTEHYPPQSDYSLWHE